MKKIINILMAVVFSVSFSGCLKDKALNDFSGISPIIELQYHGLEGFPNDAILTAGVTDLIVVPLVVNIASTNTLSKDVQVTLAIDDGVRTQYNAKGGVQYQALPAADYTFTVKTGTIKAGSRLDTFYVTFDPTKIDPTINYMLPIKIADASGVTISGNFGVAYLHIIGNPLAGNYTWDFYRWNKSSPSDTAGQLSTLSFWGHTVTFLPDNPTTVEFPSGYFTQKNYVMSFTNTGGVLSDFKIAPSDAMLQSFSDNGITIVEGPTLLIADPIAKHFKVMMRTASRFLIDDYYK